MGNNNLNNEIKPHYVTFEQAKLLKDKGFDVPMHHYYFEDGEFKEHSLTGTNGYYGEDYEFNLSEFNENWNDRWLTKKSGDRCFGCSKDRGYFGTYSAPEQWQVIEWIRINHDIHITYDIGLTGYYGLIKYRHSTNSLYLSKWSNPQENPVNSPQKAYSVAIDYVLNNLI